MGTSDKAGSHVHLQDVHDWLVDYKPDSRSRAHEMFVHVLQDLGITHVDSNLSRWVCFKTALKSFGNCGVSGDLSVQQNLITFCQGIIWQRKSI